MADSPRDTWAAHHARTVGRTGASGPPARPPAAGAPEIQPRELMPSVRVDAEPVRLADFPADTHSLAVATDPYRSPPVLASGSGRAVYLWNLVTGERLATCSGHRGRVRSTEFVPLPGGGLLLASGGEDGTVRLWDPATGRHLHTFRDHAGTVHAVAATILPDGSPVLVSAGGSAPASRQRPGSRYRIFVTDPATRRRLRILDGHTGTIYALALTTLPDGTPLLASASHDATVQLWDPATGEHRATLTGHTEAVVSLAFAARRDGTPVLISGGGSEDKTLRVWNPVTGGLLRTVTGFASSVRSLTIVTRPDRTPLLAYGSGIEDGAIRLADPVTGETLRTIPSPSSRLWSTVTVAAGPDGDLLLVGAMSDGDARRWRVQLAPGHRAADRTDDAGPTAEPDLRGVAAGLVALAGAGVHPPLGLLADLVGLTGGTPPERAGFEPLLGDPGVQRLRALAWPPAARVGLAALLVADLPAEDRYVAPDDPPQQLYEALNDALRRARTAAGQVPVPTGPLVAAAGRVTDQTVTLLAVLGPDAVAADPALPLRMRDRVDQLPPLDTGTRAVLAHGVHRRGDTGPRAAAPRSTGGTNGVSSRGSLANLMHAQLALPRGLFALRYARGELLYRLHDRPVAPPLHPVTIVLDTTPATFGPQEAVLRTVAHALAAALWSVALGATLVSLDNPRHPVPLARPADLVTLWSTRALYPPDLGTALDTAARSANRTTVVLTDHHLAREHPVVATPALRLLTTHAPGAPPVRRAANRYHLHLPPHPTTRELARAVASLLEPDGTA